MLDAEASIVNDADALGLALLIGDERAESGTVQHVEGQIC